MTKARHNLWVSVLAGVVAGASLCGAAPRRGARFRHADRNKDGRIGPREAVAEKRFERKVKSKVNTPAEKAHDTDGDGWINGEEAKEMLRDRLRIINTHGRARVNTPLEAEFDADGDGVIDREEAQAIRDAVGE